MAAAGSDPATTAGSAQTGEFSGISTLLLQDLKPLYILLVLITTIKEKYMGNRNKLIVIQAKHELTANQVAKMLDVSVDTVYSWRSRDKSDIPKRMLELLEYKLQNIA